MMEQGGRAETGRPVVVVDGCQWDLGNLCSSSAPTEMYISTNSSPYGSHGDSEDPIRGDGAHEEDPISDGVEPITTSYPSLSDIPESLDIEDIFKKLNETRARENARTKGVRRRPPAMMRKSDGSSSSNPSPPTSNYLRTIHSTRPEDMRSSIAADEGYRRDLQNQSQGTPHDGRLDHSSSYQSHPSGYGDSDRMYQGGGYQDPLGSQPQQSQYDYQQKQQRQPYYDQSHQSRQQPPSSMRQSSRSSNSRPSMSNGSWSNPPRPEPQRTMVEVMPGEFVPLRGSVETWEAVQSGSITKTTCTCCTIDLVCVEDADLVMCPACRVISPVEGNTGSGGGLGLGMSVQDAKFELNRRGMMAERRS